MYLVRCLISLNEYSGSSKWLILICFRLYRRTHVVFPSSSSPLRTFLFGAGDAGEILEKEPGPNHFVAYWQLALSFFVRGEEGLYKLYRRLRILLQGCGWRSGKDKKEEEKKEAVCCVCLKDYLKSYRTASYPSTWTSNFFFFLFSLRFAKGGNQESKLRKWR